MLLALRCEPLDILAARTVANFSRRKELANCDKPLNWLVAWNSGKSHYEDLAACDQASQVPRLLTVIFFVYTVTVLALAVPVPIFIVAAA